MRKLAHLPRKFTQLPKVLQIGFYGAFSTPFLLLGSGSRRVRFDSSSDHLLEPVSIAVILDCPAQVGLTVTAIQ